METEILTIPTKSSNDFHHFFKELGDGYLDEVEMLKLNFDTKIMSKTEYASESEYGKFDDFNCCDAEVKKQFHDGRKNSQTKIKMPDHQNIVSQSVLTIKSEYTMEKGSDGKVQNLRNFFERLSVKNSPSNPKICVEKCVDKLKIDSNMITSPESNSFISRHSLGAMKYKSKDSVESLSFSDDTITFDSISSNESNDEVIIEKKKVRRVGRRNTKEDLCIQDEKKLPKKTADRTKNNSLSKEKKAKSNTSLKLKKKKHSKEDLDDIATRPKRDSVSKLKPRKDSASKPRRDSNSNKEDKPNPILLYTWEINPTEIKFDEKIGEGSSCSVYKGTYRGQVVALKTLKDSGKKQNENFIKEFDIMSQFRSPFVVYFFGGCIEPIPTMVLGYCANGSLYELLHDQNINVDWNVVVKVALNVLKGLDSMHNWKPQLVHRDLKSRNILVEEDWQTKLCDFGESRYTINSNEQTLCKMRGTYAYVAPEVYYGQLFTTKSDVYAFSIVLWELCTRCVKKYYELPYSNQKLTYDFQIIVQTSKNGLRPVLDENIPKSLANLMKKCWDHDPCKRPETKELIEYFESIIDVSDNPSKWKSISSSKEKLPKSGKHSKR